MNFKKEVEKVSTGQVFIVGLGPGSRDYILPKAIKTLDKSDLILGFKRAVDSISFINREQQIVKSLKEIINTINENLEKSISIVASGDPCFYGVTNYIKKNISGEITIIPGISSFQYLMAKLSKPWQGAFLGSMHGREEEFINKVKENQISIWLTDKHNSPDNLCRKLIKESISANVYIGENLSYEDEIITIGSAEELQHKELGSLAVVVIERNI